MVKLGFLCGSMAWGGLEMNQLKNASWLKEKGYTCFLLCKEGSPIKSKAEERGIAVILIPSHRRYKYFFAGLRFAKIITTNQLTHVIVRDSKDLNICSIAKTFSRQSFHLSYFMEMQIGVSKRNFLHTARYKKIDAWFCPLGYLKKQVLRFTRFPEKKIHLLPSALELKGFSTNKKELRKELRLPESDFVVGIVGRIDPHKGQLELVEAIHELNIPSVVLCMIGSPTLNEADDYMDQIQRYIRQHSLEKRIYHIPHVENAEKYFQAFDVSVMASQAETFGMVTIESLANGVPVIGTNSGGTPEILEQGKYGLLYEFGDREALKRQIVSIYLKERVFDADELKAYARNFSFETIVKEIEKKLGLLKK